MDSQPYTGCFKLSLTLLILASGFTNAHANQDGPLLEEPSTAKPTSDQDESLLLNTDLPIFLAEPQNAFVVRNRPANLHCRAAHSLRAYFKCNGAKNIETAQFEFVDPQTGVRIIEAEANITRDMVEEFFGHEKFKCECFAWNGKGTIKSQSASVEVAYLKKQFEVYPETTTRVEIGHQMELKCMPPQGMPPPRVYWLRGDQVLQSDTAVLVTSEGHLLIGQARTQDTGNYTCIAENIAAKRAAPTSQIIVYIDGGWSPWSAWSDCGCPGVTLSSGKMSTRTCTNPPPSNGGKSCVGQSIRRTKDCVPCIQAEPARWSAWSEWSDCSPDCIRTRKRQCIPGNTAGKKTCNGKDTQTNSCSTEQCRTMELTRVTEKNLQTTQKDILVYIGLTLAIFLVCILSFFVVRIYRKKGQHQSLYDMASNVISEYHPEFFPEHDKKSLSLQPDLTKTVPPCYEYPYTTPATSVTRSVSEHHYDVPHLASGSDIQMSPATSSTLESSSGKRSQLSGFTNNSDSTYEVATESVTLPLPTAYAVTPTTSGNYTSSTVSHSGAFLNLTESAVSLLIPEGAVSRSRKQELFLSILNEDCFRPKLAENITQLSPVVSCGPNVSLNKAVILKVPHCAELTRNNWSISVLQSDCSDSQWQNAVTLGQETINTNVYCQLDKDSCYLVTECLSRFVVVGRSTNGNAIKRLRLAVFAPKLCFQSSSEYSIRVYILEDTESSMETVYGQEKRLGGYLLDEPRSITFHDGGSNLCLNIESLTESWHIKNGLAYQEIPFRQIWQANSNSLHCSFTLETVEGNKDLSFKIRINQKGFDYQQVFDITCKDDGETISNKTSSVKLHHNELVPKITIQSETSKSSDSKKSIDFSHSPKSAKSFKLANVDLAKNLILTDRGVSTCDDFNFRLSKQLRKQLCQCLDPPTQRGNDWRMLAHALSVDRYINFFATKPSPTDCILDLWEARNRESNALTELRHILNDMERYDAVTVLDNSLGPNWL